MDETRIERALREGPPFRTHYVGQPLPLSSQAAGTHLAPLRHDRRGISTGLIVVVTLLLTLIIGGAALVGSGILKLPAVVDASASPSATADASADASATPVEQVPASWSATGAMSEPRWGHVATLLFDGTVLVTGGYNGSKHLASAELYDPVSGSWSATGDMIEVRTYHTATRLQDGRVLVVGVGDISMRYTAELYDPRTGTWSATGDPITPTLYGSQSATLLADGRVLVADGGSAELFDPVRGSWSATGNMIAERSYSTATRLLDGTVLVAGGWTHNRESETLASAELYDPSTEQWTATGAMIEARAGGTATRLQDGRVLVAGGGILPTPNAAELSAEVYDPSTGSWTATASMGGEAHLGATATLLSDGTVLATGGGMLPSAEVYDPSAGSWTATASMGEAHLGASATLLADGTVLLAGGYIFSNAEESNQIPLGSAELYEPGSGT
jgi:Kelch motif